MSTGVDVRCIRVDEGADSHLASSFLSFSMKGKKQWQAHREALEGWT